MKNILFFLIISTILIFSCKKDEPTNGFEDEEVSLGGNLVYDVFYSFSQGEVAKVKRSDWDIAFSVPLQTATIRINEGSGVELFSVGGAADWENIVISGGSNVLKKLWNDKSDWLKGAFNLYPDPDNVFNYSWGTYDHASTYNVIGDSVYVIKLTNGSQKKIYIEKRDGHENKYYLKWADPDGSGLDSAIIDMAVNNKNFVYFSLVDNKVIDYEPDADLWDLLFTVYKAQVPTGPDSYIDYDVMGVLTNEGYKSTKIEEKDPIEACSCDSDSLIQQADLIGWDWKVFDNQTQAYTITNNLSFFVKDNDNIMHQIYFTGYDGTKSGNITFKKRISN